MKGKFRILGHIGIGVLLVCALMLAFMPAVPVAAATAVTSVWVDFPYSDAPNTCSGTSNTYIVHFKPTTALERGVDYVTVTFPDGSTAMGGDGNTGGDYVFTISSTAPAASTVDFSTDYTTTDLVVDASWTDCTAAPTVGGNRMKVLSPIDVAAGQDVWVRFVCGSAITAATTEASTYKVYVATTKDTTPVLSSAFALGNSTYVAGSTAMVSGYPLPATAGSTATYILTFVPANGTTLTASSSKVTIKFPLQATVPSSLSVTDVSFSAAGTTYTNTPETPVVNVNTREVTAITPLDMTGNGSDDWYIKIGGITNPTIADATSYMYMIRTSGDGKYECTGADPITAGSITQVIVANGEIGTPSDLWSDNATMVDMYSSQIYLALADQYGNAKAPDSPVTVTLSSSSSTGQFYWCDTKTSMTDTVTSCTSVSVDIQDPNAADDGDQIVYYKDSTAGTHTLTFAATSYTSATWTFTVCPGVSLYDSSNNLISTYAPISTSPTAETGDSDPYVQKYGVDYINDAITAAFAGDTVKLGDGIYELDNDATGSHTYPWAGAGVGISLDKKITLTSVNGASSTTLRNTEDLQAAVYVTGVDGTATNPIIIDGLTFQRLRSGIDIFRAVLVDGTDYVTVRNCVFNYIIPDCTVDACSLSDGSDTGVPGAVVDYCIYNAETHIGGVTHDITSATVSNNTFNNCGTFGAETYGHEAMILMFSRRTGGEPLTGGVISGNTITNCNGRAICVKGNAADLYVTASITNNTITNPYTGINMEAYAKTISVTGNTVTGSYKYGIWSEGNGHNQLTIKNNTVTGTAGAYAVYVENDPDAFATESVYDYIQYNDISGCASGVYAIYMASGVTSSNYTEINCNYNYYGDASGPAYTALTGATVTKSNPNGTGDIISDNVTYYPWLHKPLADVVADNASYQTSNMQLGSGWNTLSTPVKLISAADAVDELIPSGMTIGYYYSGGWQQITTGYVLNPCDAVYVKMSESKYVQFKFDAGAFSTPSKDLDAGWNLASLASLDSNGMYADLAVASVAKTAANLPGYAQVVSPSINATQTDMYGNTGTSWTVSYGQTSVTSNMFAGLGYWVYMQNAATLAGFEITPIAPDLD